LKASNDRRAKQVRTFLRSKEIKMSKNRLPLIAAVLLILVVSLAVSRPFTNDPISTDLSAAPAPISVPVTGAEDASDYYQRHADRSNSGAAAVDMSDFFIRHPELRGEITESVKPASQSSPIDECFDVSVSELAACREASQSAAE
jgi:hypothetical protein